MCSTTKEEQAKCYVYGGISVRSQVRSEGDTDLLAKFGPQIREM
jgi:hypothetical protein